MNFFTPTDKLELLVMTWLLATKNALLTFCLTLTFVLHYFEVYSPWKFNSGLLLPKWVFDVLHLLLAILVWFATVPIAVANWNICKE
jgi:hypothetical protein